MAERLFNVYMLKHGKKLKFFNFYVYTNPDDMPHTPRHKFIWFIVDLFGYFRDELTAALLRSRGKFLNMLLTIWRIVFKREK